MLLYPPVAELADKAGSRYQLVNMIAQRARKISAEYEANNEPLDEKPVSIAINEVYTGKLKLIHHDSNSGGEGAPEDSGPERPAEENTAEPGEE